MKFEKPPSTINQQIELITSRGMVVEDPRLAKKWLETVGYYRLAGYWLAFEKPPAPDQTRSKNFTDNTKFEEIIDIYVFDRRLRLLLLEGIERIEINLRARWTNRFSLDFGAHGYIDHANFTCAKKLSKSLSKLSAAFEDSQEKFAKHYRSKYNEPTMPPLWAATELMTLGELSTWIENTNDSKLLKYLAKDLGLPSRETLTGSTHVLSLVRNIAAHHGRMWNRKTVKRIPNIKKFADYFTYEANSDATQRQVSNNMYNVIVLVCLLVKHQASNSTYPKKMRELIEYQPEKTLNDMGFHEKWKKLDIWN